MADKAIYSVDTVSTMADTDKVYVNTGNNIKQITKDNLCGNDIKALNDNVTELKVLGWNVPKECPIQNTVSGNTFTQKVGRVKLSDLGFGYASSLFQYSFAEAKKPSANNVVANIYTSNYKTVFYYSGGQGVSTNDKSIALDMNGKLYVKDSTYTDVTTFKNANNGTYLYYELATYKTFNIDGNEVSERIENELSDYGLNNVFDGDITYGYWYNYKTGAYSSVANNFATLTNKTYISEGNILTVFCSKVSNISCAFFKSDDTYISGVEQVTNKFVVTAPSNASYVRINFWKSEYFGDISSSVGVYVNNQIDVVKNDLADMKKVYQVSATSDTSGTISIAYPSGCNQNTCILLCAKVSNGGYWKNFDTSKAINYGSTINCTDSRYTSANVVAFIMKF